MPGTERTIPRKPYEWRDKNLRRALMRSPNCGAFVRAARLSLGLTQREVADSLGIPREIMSLIEKHNLSINRLRAEQMAKRLRVSQDRMEALAGYTPFDVFSLLQERPELICGLIRTSANWSDEEIERILGRRMRSERVRRLERLFRE